VKLERLCAEVAESKFAEVEYKFAEIKSKLAEAKSWLAEWKVFYRDQAAANGERAVKLQTEKSEMQAKLDKQAQIVERVLIELQSCSDTNSSTNNCTEVPRSKRPRTADLNELDDSLGSSEPSENCSSNSSQTTSSQTSSSPINSSHLSSSTNPGIHLFRRVSDGMDGEVSRVVIQKK
jgi:hypothetical protein